MIRFKPEPEQRPTEQKSPERPANFKTKFKSRESLANALLMLAVLAGGWLTFRVFSAEQQYQQALAIAGTDGVAAYNALQEAVKKNPYQTRYQRSFALLNLSLSNSLAGQLRNEASPSAQKVGLVRNLAARSVQQARIGVSLSPGNPRAWETLGSIYNALAHAAKGADSWAQISFERAVALSPNDPLLRFQLGGVYFRQEEYNAAINQFIAATQLKPNYVNAWYNLGLAFKAQKNHPPALEAFRNALGMITQENRADRDRVEREIAELGGRVPPEEEASPAGGGPQEELREPTETSPSAKNVPPPVEVEGPPTVEEATESSKVQRLDLDKGRTLR